MNIFASILTYPAPSSNYRGESEENRTVIQKITKGNQEYAIISPESMRNALREILASYGLPSNRSRLHDEDQLAVEFQEVPNATKFADDFIFGFMVANTKEMKGKGPSKRDSVLRMNMAVALTPYRYNATFHQSPLNAGKSPWKNAGNSALLHREVSHTAYQYPFALAVTDFTRAPAPQARAWGRELLKAIGELSNVAGGHARSYFEMAPRSIILRLSPSLAAGFNTYAFDESGHFSELSRIGPHDLPGSEFWLGGELVRGLSPAERTRLADAGVHLYDSPQLLLREVANQAFGTSA